MVETLVGDKSSVTTAKYTLDSPQAPHSAWSAQTFCNPCQKLRSPTFPNPPNENLIAKICLISSHNCHCKNGCVKIPATYKFFLMSTNFQCPVQFYSHQKGDIICLLYNPLPRYIIGLWIWIPYIILGDACLQHDKTGLGVLSFCRLITSRKTKPSRSQVEFCHSENNFQWLDIAACAHHMNVRVFRPPCRRLAWDWQRPWGLLCCNLSRATVASLQKPSNKNPSDVQQQ